MDFRMAKRAKSDQIELGIISGLTAKLLVVDFKSRHCPAELTPPSIAPQYFLPLTFVGIRIKA
jgi:hypothetical protein